MSAYDSAIRQRRTRHAHAHAQKNRGQAGALDVRVGGWAQWAWGVHAASSQPLCRLSATSSELQSATVVQVPSARSHAAGTS